MQKRTIYCLCPRKPQSSISFLSVLSQVLHFLHGPGVCWNGKKAEERTVPPGLSPPPLSPLSTPLSRSPKKVLLILLMLPSRDAHLAPSGLTRGPSPGELCALHWSLYHSQWHNNGEGSGPKADWCEYPNFSLLFDTLTFGKCRKRRMNKTTTYDMFRSEKPLLTF